MNAKARILLHRIIGTPGKVEKWITEDEIGGRHVNGFGGMGGFFKKGMKWINYLDHFKPSVHPALEELRKSILENGIRCTREQKQEDGGLVVPLWSNGKVDTYSWRAWGDLMAAVWSEHDNKDYSYMDFYM